MIQGRNKVIQVWNNMTVSRWHSFHFWVNCSWMKGIWWMAGIQELTWVKGNTEGHWTDVVFLVVAGASGREIVPAQVPLQWHGRRELAPDIEVTQRVGRLGILTPGLTPLLNTALIVSPWHTHTQSGAKQKVARHVVRMPPFYRKWQTFCRMNWHCTKKAERATKLKIVTFTKQLFWTLIPCPHTVKPVQ